jgi:hypothetical protein
MKCVLGHLPGLIEITKCYRGVYLNGEIPSEYKAGFLAIKV